MPLQQSGFAGAVPQYAPPSAQPRELGIIDRLIGVRNGIDEIHARLRVFAERLQGSGSAGNDTEAPSPAGIPASLSCAEARIRQTLELISNLEQAF